MSRFEVRGLTRDKALIRRLAKRLSTNDEAARSLRWLVREQLAVRAHKPRNIYEWLRSSPLVGVDLRIEREFDPGRKIDL